MTLMVEINATTGEEITREMTDVEQEIYNVYIEKEIKEEKAKQAKAKAKAAAREALLDRLGITADEAALLLG